MRSASIQKSRNRRALLSNVKLGQLSIVPCAPQPAERLLETRGKLIRVEDFDVWSVFEELVTRRSDGLVVQSGREGEVAYC